MFRNILFYLWVFLVCSFGHAQNQYEYVGAIIVEDTLPRAYPYKINLIEVGGAVTGYAITNIGTVFETKNTIFGDYDAERKELKISEAEMIYTKAPIKEDEISCFVNFSIRPFVFGKTKRVKGRFIGMSLSSEKCAEGDIFLTSFDKVEARMSKAVKKINRSKRIADSIKKKINPLKMMDSLTMNVLRKDQILSVFSSSESVKLMIYDGGKEDGDKITIYVNDKIVLNKYEANNAKKVISVDLIDDKTSIVFRANNEGLIAPNTIVVEVDDKNNNIRALSNLKTNETTQIDILKRK